MEYEQDVNSNFLKGFNEGYLISEHLPELAKSLSASVSNISERTNGFKAGCHQYELEHNKDYTIELGLDRDKGDDYEPDKEMNRDDYQKE